MMPRFPFNLLLVVVSRFFLALCTFLFSRSDFVQTTVIFFSRFSVAGLLVSKTVKFLSPSLFCYEEPLFRWRTELHIFLLERSHLTGCRHLIGTVNKWVHGALGWTNFPNGFSERFQRVRGKKTQRVFPMFPTVWDKFPNSFFQRLQRVKKKTQRLFQRLQRFRQCLQRVPNGQPTALAVQRKTISVRLRVRGHIFCSLKDSVIGCIFTVTYWTY